MVSSRAGRPPATPSSATSEAADEEVAVTLGVAVEGMVDIADHHSLRCRQVFS
jgi:hypothetical protein